MDTSYYPGGREKEGSSASMDLFRVSFTGRRTPGLPWACALKELPSLGTAVERMPQLRLLDTG